MSYNTTAIAQKGEFLNLVDHIALQDHFGGVKKKRRGKKRASKEDFEKKVNEDKMKQDLRSSIILAWVCIKQAMDL